MLDPMMMTQSALTRSCWYRSRGGGDRKSTRLNSSHGYISYAVFCLKKKKVVVANAHGPNHVVIHKFNNAQCASSWRRSHQHPAFRADGKRLYYNVSCGNWTQL